MTRKAGTCYNNKTNKVNSILCGPRIMGSKVGAICHSRTVARSSNFQDMLKTGIFMQKVSDFLDEAQLLQHTTFIHSVG